MFQILCIVARGSRLSVAEGCVSVRNDGHGKPFVVSFDDLDAVIVEEQAVTLTGEFLVRLAEKRIPVILCDRHHLPVSVLDPFIADGADSHTLLLLQIAAPLPWQKQLWQKLVRAKIAGQSANLTRCGQLPMAQLVRSVRSGDPGNIEARAAALYWSRLRLFSARDRYAQDANRLFNYVYTLLYSAFARYLCAAALNPDIGIHHRSKYNHFALASDLMEPFRPVADQCVFRFMEARPGTSELDVANRTALLEQTYNCRVRIAGRVFSLWEAVNETVHSYKRSLVEKEVSRLSLPEVM